MRSYTHNKCLLFSCSIFSSVSLFVGILLFTHARQDNARRIFVNKLRQSGIKMDAAISAARRSPFWKMHSRKDVVFARINVTTTEITLLRPCRIEVCGVRYAVSLELWSILYHLAKEEVENDGFDNSAQ